MALRLRDVRMFRDGVRLLGGLSLEIPIGMSVSLLAAPADPGRTAVLRAACGLWPMAAGRVMVDGRDVTNRPPHARGLAWVSRDDLRAVGPASVRATVAFAARGRDVRPVLAATGLTGKEDELVSRLSPGLRSSVQLARAVASNPACLLLDEPGFGLDSVEQAVMFQTLRRLCDAGVAMLIATVVPATALALSDRAVVLVGGAARQAGWTRALHDSPVDEVVASLFGPLNRLPGRIVAVEDDLATVRLDCGPNVDARADDLAIGSRCVVGVRPADIAVSLGEVAEEGMFAGRVVTVRFFGPLTEIEIAVGYGEDSVRLAVSRPSALPLRLKPGLPVVAAWQPQHATAWPEARGYDASNPRKA